MKTYLDHAAVTVANIGWTMKLFEDVLGMHETRRKETDGKLTLRAARSRPRRAGRRFG
ncbi:hypothetical protein [uncultured Selenomonas sp.]|uniref:hypothetical protein n=1 Tax=uncultured Selenomonas sp. TaxID=159275 RepID=UPI0025D6696B|nr:hypothetical protein [uncultured Selenomonas sp.]